MVVKATEEGVSCGRAGSRAMRNCLERVDWRERSSAGTRESGNVPATPMERLMGSPTETFVASAEALMV